MILKNKKDKCYYIIYTLGLGITLLFAIFKTIFIVRKDIDSLDFINQRWVNIALLGFSVVVMLIMYARARYKIGRDKTNSTFYKDYIQLEGYIQTLIGFFIAILGIVPLGKNGEETNIEFGLVALPISLALVTSILGWYFGSDIAPPEEEKKILDKLSSATSDLKNNINVLSGEILSTKNKYEKTTDIYVTNLHRLFDAQKKTIEEYELSLLTLNQSKDDYREQIAKTLVSFKDDFKSFSTEIEQSTLSLNKKVFEIQEDNQNKQLESVKLFFTKLNSKIDNDTDDIKFLYNTFDEYLKSIKNDFSDINTKISEFLINTGILNNNTTTNVKKTNTILTSIDDEFKNIKNEIHNIKNTMLDDLYSNHKLRNDIKEINESIKNLKPNKYINFSIGLPSWFKRNKK